jgi:hypothetical protein
MSWVSGAHQARESLKTQQPLTKVLPYCPPTRSSRWHPELNLHPCGYQPTPYKLDQPTRCVPGAQRVLTNVRTYFPPIRSSRRQRELNPHPCKYEPTPYQLDQPTLAISYYFLSNTIIKV